MPWWSRYADRFQQGGTIPDALWTDALTPLPYAAALRAAEQARLQKLVIRFLRAKTFEGAAGLKVSDNMRVRIALQACLLIFNLDFDYYSGWRSVILYPGDFRVARESVDPDGIVHHWTEEMAGESWNDGPVILSWDTISTSGNDMNIVLHEFAHKIDMRNGAADGCPPLPPDISPQLWAHDFLTAYQRLRAALEHGMPSVLDAYAAESPAEFFAVASEMFFLQPAGLATDFPAIYEQLRLFYRQDPDEVLKRT
jgi:Mlc titration factor MtfA (ptsG expression regulator)